MASGRSVMASYMQCADGLDWVDPLCVLNVGREVFPEAKGELGRSGGLR